MRTSPKNKVSKIAAYCRVSTDKEDQRNSVENQKRFFKTFADDRGYELIEIYSDQGLSGTSTKKRESFNKMMSDARQGRFDTVVTKEVSRFARNTVTTLEFTRELKSKNVGVWFLNDNIYTMDDDGELRLSIMSSIAQEESRKTSQRVRWGQRRKMEQGIVFGGDLLGYKVSGAQMKIVKEEAKIVQIIYSMYLYDEMGALKIVKELENAGIATKKGSKKWTTKAIYDILKNEKYCGDLKQQKTYTPNYLTHDKKRNHGEVDFVYIKNHHNPIISCEMFERVQTELEKRSTAKGLGAKHSNRYSLSGKIKCCECNRTFVGRNRKRKDGSKRKTWVCYNYQIHGKKKLNNQGEQVGCISNEISENEILKSFDNIMREVIIDPLEIKKDLIKKIKMVTTGEKLQQNKSAELKKHISQLQKRKLTASELLADKTLTKAEFCKLKTKTDDDIKRFETELVKIKNRGKVQSREQSEFEIIFQKINNYLVAPSTGKHICRRIIERVVVNGKNDFKFYLSGATEGFAALPIYASRQVPKS